MLNTELLVAFIIGVAFGVFMTALCRTIVLIAEYYSREPRD